MYTVVAMGLPLSAAFTALQRESLKATALQSSFTPFVLLSTFHSS